MNLITPQPEADRDRWGKLTITTRVALGSAPAYLEPGQPLVPRELHITTCKSGDRAIIVTMAHVYEIEQHSRRHCFGSTRDGSSDFSKSIERTPARATEKALRAQHARVDVAAITAEAVAYYVEADAMRAARAAAQATRRMNGVQHAA